MKNVSLLNREARGQEDGMMSYYEGSERVRLTQLDEERGEKERDR